MNKESEYNVNKHPSMEEKNKMIRHGYDSDVDSGFAAAVAASAHAIHSLVEATKPINRAQEPFRPPPRANTAARSSSFLRPTVYKAEEQIRHNRGLGNSDSKTDAWEKARIASIRKRYERMSSEIRVWESEKKLREKHQMERKKVSLEQRQSRNLKHYYRKIARIDHIAGGARAQLDEKRKHEESIVKEKSRKMRSTGKTPVNCFGF